MKRAFAIVAAGLSALLAAKSIQADDAPGVRILLTMDYVLSASDELDITFQGSVSGFSIWYQNDFNETVKITASSMPEDYETLPQLKNNLYFDRECIPLSSLEEPLRTTVTEAAQHRWLENCKEVNCIEAYHQWLERTNILNRI